MSNSFNTDTDTADDENSETKTSAFSEPIPRSTDETDMLVELANEGDADAAEKLLASDTDRRALAKALEDTDDVPEWALVIAEQVEANAELLQDIRDGDAEETAGTFTM